MRRALMASGAIALVAGAATWFVSIAGAQGGGTLEVEVKYNGAPQVEKLKVNKDTEKCGTEATVEKVVVGGNKGLANAVVSVPGAKGASKAKAVVDQHGCKFVPHVTVMQPGEVEFKNSDDILHNLHTYSTANPSINKAQPKFKKTMTEKLEKPEFVKITCDVHSWMLGWVAVFYFGVPFKGSVGLLALGSALYLLGTCGLGLLISLLVRSQQAAIIIATITASIVAIQFSGMFAPVESMTGVNRWIAIVLPASHYRNIVVGAFLKRSGFEVLQADFASLAAFALVVLVACHRLFRKRTAS